jgi:hypothetical protein
MLVLEIYIQKRLGMFLFKVQLSQDCKSKTELINTKSVLQHVIRYQVLLTPYYKADTVAVVQHICQVALLTSLHAHQPFVYDTKYCWRHITKCFELNTVCKNSKRCTYRNLYSVTGNYMLLSQEFDHWACWVLYLRRTRLLIMFTMKYMNK